MRTLERNITPEKRGIIGNIKVLVFDLYDTVFDLNGTIREKVDALYKNIDSDKFTREWRKQYGLLMIKVRETVRNGGAYVKLDDLMKEGLSVVLSQFGIADFNDEEKAGLMEAWYRPKPWNDTNEGLSRLQKKGFILGTMSNASEKMQTEMLKTIGPKFGFIFSPDKVQTYKPDPKIFQQALSTKFSPSQIMMVANYTGDLVAVASNEIGFRTAYIYRSEDVPSDLNFDVIASDLVDFAEQLSA